MKKFMLLITVLMILSFPIVTYGETQIYKKGDTFFKNGISITLERVWSYHENFYSRDSIGNIKTKAGKCVFYNLKITTDKDTFLSSLGSFSYEVSDSKYLEKANKFLRKPYGHIDYNGMWGWTTKLNIDDGYDVTAIIYSNKDLQIEEIRFLLD